MPAGPDSGTGRVIRPGSRHGPGVTGYMHHFTIGIPLQELGNMTDIKRKFHARPGFACSPRDLLDECFEYAARTSVRLLDTGGKVLPELRVIDNMLVIFESPVRTFQAWITGPRKKHSDHPLDFSICIEAFYTGTNEVCNILLPPAWREKTDFSESTDFRAHCNDVVPESTAGTVQPNDENRFLHGFQSPMYAFAAETRRIQAKHAGVYVKLKISTFNF